MKILLIKQKEALYKILENIEYRKNSEDIQRTLFDGVLQGNIEIYQIIYGKLETNKLTCGLGIHKRFDSTAIQKELRKL